MSARRPVAVLMYHAIEPVGADSDADPHYSVEPATFAAQLDAFAGLGRRVRSVRDLLADAAAGASTGDAVALTFDDGHASNGAAAEMLAARGMAADFFVNPAQVGGPHRLSWAALRDMAAAGMSIQSHGHDHVHLDTLGPDGVHDSLARSKAAIEDALGTAVTLFAPPGGRLHPSLAATAARLGYRALCTSRPGRWTPAASAPADIPRLAVLAGTGDETLRRWALADPMTIGRARLRAGALDAAKRLLGTGRYERLRAAALKGGA
ncbi:MAG: polysaccharide deacetylase family protein [Burkholderiales bacterium]